MKKNTKKAFSLVEVLTTIAIIGILSSIVLVNLNGSKVKSRDRAVFTQIMSAQSVAYKCIRSSIPDVTLDSPISGAGAANTVCSTNSASAVAGYPDWPVLATNSGWTYSDSTFHWCSTSSSLSTLPSGASISANYTDGSMGGARAIGRFCYRLTNGSKYIWCTQDGCAKQGF